MQVFKPVQEILEEGITFHKQERFRLAEEKYLEVLMEDPDNAQALFLLGSIYIISRRIGLACQLLLRCVVLKGNHFEAWNNLGNCYKAINKENEALECWEASLKIEGRNKYEYADVYNNLATVFVNAGTPEEGIPYLEKALKLNPEHADALWNMALVQLELGNFEAGFKGYSAGFKTNNRLYRAYGPVAVDWKGENVDKMQDKTIAVWGEQGIGDEILFASIIPELAKKFKTVIVDCHPRLATLFKSSFPENVVVYGTRKENLIPWPYDHPELEYKCALGDLPLYFRKKLEDFPSHTGYLRPEPSRVQHYKKKLAKMGPRLKVGISWTGGYKKTRKDYRSVMLDQWGPIFGQDVDFISLQYTPDAYKVVAEAEEMFDIRIHHWPGAVEATDYHETAALVGALDLVITVNTAVHHLAGAMGIACWTLTPIAKAWRYYSPAEDNSTIPWYPSVRQFQQKELLKWEDVIEHAALWVRELADAHDLDSVVMDQEYEKSEVPACT